MLAEALCRRCRPEDFSFKTTAELEPLEIPLGQERALEAIRFGAAIKHPGYNIFVYGPAGAGRHSLVSAELRVRAAKESPPHDWVYLHNFERADEPNAMPLPRGRGRELKSALDKLLEEIRTTIPAAFESEDYNARVQAINEQFEERQGQALEAIRKEANEKSLALLRTPMGFALAPLKGSEVIKPEAFNKLPEGERKAIKKKVEEMQQKLQEALLAFPKWDKERREAIRDVNREVTAFTIGLPIEELKHAFSDLPEVLEHLEFVRLDLIDNVHGLLGVEAQMRQQTGGFGEGAAKLGNGFARYAVNLLVDNAEQEEAPIVFEDHPSLPNLIGRVEYVSQMGVLSTDFSLIKPGALHRANGGYLAIDARKLLTEPFAWETLKRLLTAKEIKIETVGEALGLVSTMSLKPEPIPLSVKIVLIGEPMIYYLLSQLDPEFPALFKIGADFDDRLSRDQAEPDAFPRLLAGMIARFELKPFDRGGVAAVLERASRLVEDSEKFSLNLERIADLLREADHIATESGADSVGAGEVRAALDAQRRRASRISERMQEAITRGIVRIATEGSAVGQVNGLSVYQLGEHAFGKPTRISARAWLGSGKVVDIEREVELGGPLHSKGVLILQGFLGERYAIGAPLSISASLVFEQSYGGVEGDSASSAELYALLSALADRALRQSFAVTGSVDQHGSVQAIGGVNEKIEGFFDLCVERGLSGDQGVLIPAANMPHLMLKAEVVEAVRDGRFAIYPVTTIDEGLEILSGIPAGERPGPGEAFPEGSFNRLVEDRLASFAKARKSFAAKEAPGGKEVGP
ncbi:MAG: ATP-binding protein [Limibacillus sp.]